MAQWTGTGSNRSAYIGYLNVWESDHSVEDNDSEISYSLVLKGTGWYYFQDWYLETKISINGSLVQDRDEKISMPSPDSNGESSYTVITGKVQHVKHNTDGTKSVAVWAQMKTSTSQSYLPGTINMPSGLNGSLTLTNIPRASSLSVPALKVDESATLTITAASNTFSHVIKYAFHDLSGTIATLNAGVSSTTWTPPSTFYAKMPSATSDIVTITIETYTGGTLIGTNTYNCPISIGDAIKPTAPTVTLSPVNTNAWLNSQGLYVGGYSRVRIVSSASPGTGATMQSYVISGAVTGSGADFTSAVLSDGAKSITVTAIDSRGRTNSTTVSVTFLAYANPAFASFVAERGSWDGSVWTPDVNGDHIRLEAPPAISLSAQGNTASVSARASGVYADVSTGNYKIWTTTNATTSYTIVATVMDSLYNSTSKTTYVFTIEVPFNVDVDLPGAAFGMIAQLAGVVEISPSWDLKLKNYMLVDFVIEEGTSGDWTYRKWFSGVAECWGKFQASITSWSAEGALYKGMGTGAQITPYYPSSLFVAAPELQASPHSASIDTIGVEMSGAHTDGHAPKLIVLAAASGSSGDIDISLHAIGAWK